MFWFCVWCQVNLPYVIALVPHIGHGHTGVGI